MPLGNTLNAIISVEKGASWQLQDCRLSVQFLNSTMHPAYPGERHLMRKPNRSRAIYLSWCPSLRNNCNLNFVSVWLTNAKHLTSGSNARRSKCRRMQLCCHAQSCNNVPLVMYARFWSFGEF